MRKEKRTKMVGSVKKGVEYVNHIRNSKYGKNYNRLVRRKSKQEKDYDD